MTGLGAMVGWDRDADRASNDADVSSILPIIPCGGFSPVRLEGWHIRRDLPETSISLNLLPACADRRPVCLRPSCHSATSNLPGKTSALPPEATLWHCQTMSATCVPDSDFTPLPGADSVMIRSHAAAYELYCLARTDLCRSLRSVRGTICQIFRYSRSLPAFRGRSGFNR